MPGLGDDICTGSLEVYPDMFCINVQENRYRIESLKSIFKRKRRRLWLINSGSPGDRGTSILKARGWSSKRTF